MQNKVGLKLREFSDSGRKGIAWLIDPDDIHSPIQFEEQVREAVELKIDFFFLGGSLIQQNTVGEIIRFIKSITEQIPVVIFPGNSLQFSPLADAILFLSVSTPRKLL